MRRGPTEENYSRWLNREAELERWLSKRPVCCHCHSRIQGEHLWLIYNDTYCDDCASDEFRKWTEDYIL